MHLGAYVTYMAFYLPDALPRASLVSEQLHVAGVSLWIVGANQAQEGTLARTIVSTYCPVLALAHYPRERP